MRDRDRRSRGPPAPAARGLFSVVSRNCSCVERASILQAACCRWWWRGHRGGTCLQFSRSSLDWPAPTLWLPSAPPPACSTTVMWPTSSTKQPKGNPAMLLLGALFLFVAGAPGLPIIFTHPPSPSPLPALPHTEFRNPPPPPCDILLQDLSHALDRPTTALSRRQSHEFLNQHGPAARGANISRISRWATQSHAHSASAANGSPIATTSTTSHRRDYKSPRPRRNSKNNNNKRYTNTPSPPCYSLPHSHATRRTRHSRACNPRSSPRRPPARRKFRLTSPSTPSSTRAAPCNPSSPRPRCPSPRRPSHRRTRRIRSSSSFPHHP